MNINYDGRRFRGRSNSSNGEVDATTMFRYTQLGERLTGEYAGGSVIAGQLLGIVHTDGSLEFCYHHINADGVLMAGLCHSTPSLDDSGVLCLRERWQWLTGDQSSGESEVEEIT